MDINQPSLGLVYQGLVEDLEEIHLRAYKVFGRGVQELLNILRNNRDKDGHTLDNDGNIAHTFLKRIN